MPLFYYSQQLHDYSHSHYRGARGVEGRVSTAHVQNLMVLNKADFLTTSQRLAWGRELTKRGLRFVWFSAKLSQEQLNAEERAARDSALPVVDDDEEAVAAAAEAAAAEAAAWEEHYFTGGEEVAALTDNEDDEEDDEEEADDGEEAAVSAVGVKIGAAKGGAARGGAEDAVEGQAGEDVGALTKLLDRTELLRTIEALAKAAEAAKARNWAGTPASAAAAATTGAGGAEKRAQVGIVGYPNVGKSSVINVLLGATPLNHSSLRVATGAMPGKTKHFQTLNLPPLPPLPTPPVADAATAPAMPALFPPALPPSAAAAASAPAPVLVTLCDCPGLVFPQFVSSGAEMLCAGVLPVAQLRDHGPPVRLVTNRVPRALLEATYGFRAPRVGTEGWDAAGGEAEALARASANARAASSAKDAKDLSEFMTVEALLVGVGKARSWFASGNKGEVDRSRVARQVLSDMQSGKLLYCLPPPCLVAGSAGYANFVATTHRAKLADLVKRGKRAPRAKDERGGGGGGGVVVVSSSGGDGGGGGSGSEDEDALAVAALSAALSSKAKLGDDEDGWMDAALAVELTGGVGSTHTRLRTSKNAKLEKKSRGKKKGRKAFAGSGEDQGESGTAHALGRKGTAVATRPVMPHHAGYKGAETQRPAPTQGKH